MGRNQSVLDIIIKTIKQGDGDKRVVSALTTVKSAGAAAMGAFAALAGTAYTLNQAFNATVGTTVNLANQVRAVSQVSGLSAEESSKLIQITDDLKISQEDLLKVMQKNGDQYDYSTAGLAKMSDEYLALTDANEKADYMQERFGKSWGNFVELMEQGSGRIIAAGDGISEALIFDQKALDSAREYERQIDNLQDAVLAYKVAIGNELLPAVTTMMTVENRTIQLMEEGLNPYEARRQAAQELTIANMELAEGMKEGLVPALQDVTTSTEDAAAAAQAASEANQNFLSMLGSAQSVYEGYIEKNKQLADERAQLEDEKAKLIAQGYSAQGEKVQEVNAKLEENKKKSKEVADQFDLDNKRIMLGYLERKLTADGTLTDAELKWLLEKGVAWGVYSETAITAMQDAMAEADALIAKLEEIPSEITTSVTYTETRTTTGNTPRAIGGDLIAGQPYLVHQDEVIVPAMDGYTLTRTDAMRALESALGGGGGRGGRSITIYGGVTVIAQGGVLDALEELGA